MDEILIILLGGSRSLRGRRLGSTALDRLELERKFLRRDKQDLSGLQSLGPEVQVLVALIDLLDGHPVCLADRIERLLFLDDVGIVELAVVAYLLGRYFHLRRYVVLGGNIGRECRKQANGCHYGDDVSLHCFL